MLQLSCRPLSIQCSVTAQPCGLVMIVMPEVLSARVQAAHRVAPGPTCTHSILTLDAVVRAATSEASRDLGIQSAKSAATLLRLETSPSGKVRLPSDEQDTASTKRKAPKHFQYGPGMPLEGSSLYIFGPDNSLRKAAASTVVHRWFDRTILLLVLASSVALALDSPVLEQQGPMKQALVILDYIFVAAFVVEALVKIVAMGLAFNGRSSYLRSAWNVLDFIIALLGVITVVLELGAVGGGDELAALR